MSGESRREFGELLARQCPDYTQGTIVLTDDDGNVTGYGRLRRDGDGVAVTVAPPPRGVSLLTPLPPSSGGEGTS
jgi:hypothetical protein